MSLSLFLTFDERNVRKTLQNTSCMHVIFCGKKINQIYQRVKGTDTVRQILSPSSDCHSFIFRYAMIITVSSGFRILFSLYMVFQRKFYFLCASLSTCAICTGQRLCELSGGGRRGAGAPSRGGPWVCMRCGVVGGGGAGEYANQDNRGRHPPSWSASAP